MKNFDSKTTEYSAANAYWLAWLSKLAYEESDVVYETLGEQGLLRRELFYEGEVQSFLASNDQVMIVTFRGTDGLADVMTDINIDLVGGVGGKVHEGFQIALLKVWKLVYEAIMDDRKNQSLWLTGHSLGGALACLATAKLRLEKDVPVNGLYTFGQPRTGNRKFATNFNTDFGDKTFRFVNNNDIVTRTPFRSMGYSHVGTFKYFDEQGKPRDDIGWWEKLLDRVSGRWHDLFEPGTDGIKDHGVANYVSFLDQGWGA